MKRLHHGGVVDRAVRLIPVGDVLTKLGVQFPGTPPAGSSYKVYCFSGETQYLTRDGLKTFAETEGTTQVVLTQTDFGGHWIEARVSAFGQQKLLAVNLARGKSRRTVFATPEHRWIVQETKKHRRSVVETQHLAPGHRLAYLFPRSSISRSTPSQFGVAHGVVFGDGTLRTNGNGCVIDLWGEKDAQLLRFFSESVRAPMVTRGGVEGVRVSGLPSFFKRFPAQDESTAYLYGWLAGYFAADGSVSKTGQVVMYSADRKHLEFFQEVALRLGICSYDIAEKRREGFGSGPSSLYSVQLINSTLRESFFVIEEHRARFLEALARGREDRVSWTVESVEETDRFETVYCVTVPTYGSFVLDGFIHTMNCPFGELHPDRGAEKEMRLYADGRAFCHICRRQYDSVSLFAQFAGVSPVIAARQLLVDAGYSSRDDDQGIRIVEEVSPEKLRVGALAALAIWADARGIDRLTDERYLRCVEVADAITEEAHVQRWLDACKRRLSG